MERGREGKGKGRVEGKGRKEKKGKYRLQGPDFKHVKTFAFCLI